MSENRTSKIGKAKPPADFEENPVWTEEMHARARPAGEVHGAKIAAGMIRGRGRPPMPPGERKAKVNLRLDPDVIEGWRASGPGWQSRMNDALRAALENRSA